MISIPNSPDSERASALAESFAPKPDFRTPALVDARARSKESGASRTGDAIASFSIVANAGGVARTGRATICGREGETFAGFQLLVGAASEYPTEATGAGSGPAYACGALSLAANDRSAMTTADCSLSPSAGAGGSGGARSRSSALPSPGSVFLKSLPAVNAMMPSVIAATGVTMPAIFSARFRLCSLLLGTSPGAPRGVPPYVTIGGGRRRPNVIDPANIFVPAFSACAHQHP